MERKERNTLHTLQTHTRTPTPVARSDRPTGAVTPRKPQPQPLHQHLAIARRLLQSRERNHDRMMQRYAACLQQANLETEWLREIIEALQHLIALLYHAKQTADLVRGKKKPESQKSEDSRQTGDREPATDQKS